MPQTTTPNASPVEFTLRPIWLTTLVGGIVSATLSLIQKAFFCGDIGFGGDIRFGGNITNPWGYIGPFIFGMMAGLIVGLLVRMARMTQMVRMSLIARQQCEQHLRELDQARAELKENERGFRLLAENATDVIFRWMVAENRYDYISPSVQDITGYPPEDYYQDPRLIRRLLVPEDRQVFEEFARHIRQGNAPSPVEYRINHRNGALVWINQRTTVVRDDAGHPLCLEGFATDMTHDRKVRQEKQDLEGKLRHSQKLEALGQLTGGVAHDFNNLLTVINGYSELLLSDFPVDKDPPCELLEIRRAGGMAADLTQQMLHFSSDQETQPQVLAPERAVMNSLRMLRRIMDGDIEIDTHFAPNLPLIFLATIHLDQILMNLLVNARDAMPGGGKIHIDMTRYESSGHVCGTCRQELVGDFLLMTVRDTGTGIEPEVLDKVFDPFFSTKSPSLGRGLGLATVFGIVHKQSGHIDLVSEPGQGTAVSVYFPVHVGAMEEDLQEEANSTRPPRSMRPPQGQETILLVEDEDQVRRLTAAMLKELGYSILMAGNARQAEDIFQERDGNIDLLLTDVIMPGGDGARLAQKLCERKPDLRVVFISGYGGHQRKMGPSDLADGPGHPFLAKPFLAKPFLAKPFGADDLGWTIRRTLDAPPVAGS